MMTRIAQLMLMVQQGTACRYPALLAKLFYIPTETKSSTAFYFQLFSLTSEGYILYFVEIWCKSSKSNLIPENNLEFHPNYHN